MNAIELSHVNKSFGDFAIQDLSLTVPGGTICGLVGENGAGKSTTIRLIMNALRPDSGTVRVLGGPLPVVPVRTQGEVPKEKVLEVARALHHAAVPAPVQAGQVVLADVCGTGVAVVATKNIG